jgi:hypothetical protein
MREKPLEVECEPSHADGLTTTLTRNISADSRPKRTLVVKAANMTEHIKRNRAAGKEGVLIEQAGKHVSGQLTRCGRLVQAGTCLMAVGTQYVGGFLLIDHSDRCGGAAHGLAYGNEGQLEQPLYATREDGGKPLWCVHRGPPQLSSEPKRDTFGDFVRDADDKHYVYEKIPRFKVKGADYTLANEALQSVIIAAILVSALLAGLSVEDPDLWLIVPGEAIILALFCAELALKILAEGVRPWNYLRRRGNCFDLLVVILCFVSLLQDTGSEHGSDNGPMFAMTRVIRTFRLARLFDRVPRLQMIMSGLLEGLTSILYVGLVMLITFYVFAVAGVIFFRRNDPFHFMNLHTGVLTLFRVATVRHDNIIL